MPEAGKVGRSFQESRILRQIGEQMDRAVKDIQTKACGVGYQWASEMPPGDPRYLALLDELRRLHVKKAMDYGAEGDPLANLRASEEFGIPAWRATILRLHDKVHRLKSYCKNGRLENEGVRDTLLDLAAYSLLALRLWEEEQSCSPSTASPAITTPAP